MGWNCYVAPFETKRLFKIGQKPTKTYHLHILSGPFILAGQACEKSGENR